MLGILSKNSESQSEQTGTNIKETAKQEGGMPES